MSHHPDTRTIHVRLPRLASRPLTVPLYQTSTFAFDDPETFSEHMTKPDGTAYTRHGNPTVQALEHALADLEGGTGAVATASGMGAISTTLLALLRSGDHVLAQRRLYGGTHALFTDLKQRFGIGFDYVDSQDPATVAAALRPTTRLLYLETMANPTARVTDLPGMLRAGREAGITTVVDNTFATPVLCRPLEYGADIVVHSTTKYLGGHSDLLGGVIIAADPATHHELWHHNGVIGATADPFAAWLAIRGLHTLGLRVRRHESNAMFLATRLAAHPAVEAVHYPGLSDDPDHRLAKSMMDGYGGMLAFTVRGAARDVLTSFRLASLAPSLGGPETLVSHPRTTTHRQLSTSEGEAAGITDGTIRVSVGLEDPGDIWDDFRQALDRPARRGFPHDSGGSACGAWSEPDDREISRCIDTDDNLTRGNPVEHHDF
nr:PLP-dependent aspartate aminotransferase family protein [Kibdelosporangium sp. MJ126-NF4]CEL19800.1 O-acetylhomoserine sulfhydrylase / O-succinylhomoserine sulfhydrylase [Kibdelosporangium sp. MJ126-NF4]CTQ97025.1 O-acetylhomoserine sulfhydrylase (EC 2.5.1.49) / O-succinylhomoserine sulfhydrylase (EC 2.5.1.48) [Kibdelosporangium sp. MJ126-NF4]